VSRRPTPSPMRECEFSRHEGQWYCLGRSPLNPMDCGGLGDTREAAYAEYRRMYAVEVQAEEDDRREERIAARFNRLEM
jgi:lipocalin